MNSMWLVAPVVTLLQLLLAFSRTKTTEPGINKVDVQAVAVPPMSILSQGYFRLLTRKPYARRFR